MRILDNLKDYKGEYIRGNLIVLRIFLTASVILVTVLTLSSFSDEPYPQYGNASWYGKSLHGKKTASGERFDQHSFTGAHRSLPFGTLVRVKNLNNGKEVVITVNDRGPFVRGRIIDISRAAATHLGIVSRGVARVRVELVAQP